MFGDLDNAAKELALHRLAKKKQEEEVKKQMAKEKAKKEAHEHRNKPL